MTKEKIMGLQIQMPLYSKKRKKKGQTTKQEKNFANFILGRGCYPKYVKNLYNSIPKPQII